MARVEPTKRAKQRAAVCFTCAALEVAFALLCRAEHWLGPAAPIIFAGLALSQVGMGLVTLRQP